LFAPWLIAPASDASRDSTCVYAADNNKVCGRPDCRAKGTIPRPKDMVLLLSRRAGRRSLFAPPCQLSASPAARRLSRSGLAIGPSACRGDACAGFRSERPRRAPSGGRHSRGGARHPVQQPPCGHDHPPFTVRHVLRRLDCADAGGHWLSRARQLAHRRSIGCPG